MIVDVFNVLIRNKVILVLLGLDVRSGIYLEIACLIFKWEIKKI